MDKQINKGKVIDDLPLLVAKKNKQISKLKTTLKKYGDHLGACYKNLRMGECNCGFEQALKGETPDKH